MSYTYVPGREEIAVTTETPGSPPRGSTYLDHHSTSGIRKYRYVYNAHSASRAAGLPCFYDYTAATYCGLQVKQAATGNLSHFAGIHVETVTSGAWCWILTEGYYPSAVTRCYGSATNADLTALAYLTGINGIDALVYEAAADAAPPGSGYCINLASMASSSASSITATQAVYVFGTVR